MKRSGFYTQCFLFILLALALLCGAGCGEPAEQPQEVEADPTVIEPGVVDDPVGEQKDPDDPSEADPFPDRGEATTVAQLCAALEQVESFYFEQTIPYVDGSVFTQVWFKDTVMKISASVDGMKVSEIYYDYQTLTQLTYYPGSTSRAMRTLFDPTSVDAPNNPKRVDYNTCTVVGFETVNRQTCMVLDAKDGSRLWVGTKYGFPLKVKFVDSLGDEYEVEYKNIKYNTLSVVDVAEPADLDVIDYTNEPSQTTPTTPEVTTPTQPTTPTDPATQDPVTQDPATQDPPDEEPTEGGQDEQGGSGPIIHEPGVHVEDNSSGGN